MVLLVKCGIAGIVLDCWWDEVLLVGCGVFCCGEWYCRWGMVLLMSRRIAGVAWYYCCGAVLLVGWNCWSNVKLLVGCSTASGLAMRYCW